MVVAVLMIVMDGGACDDGVMVVVVIMIVKDGGGRDQYAIINT